MDTFGWWRELAADITWFYRWEPSVTGNMTLRRLLWWQEQAVRINRIRRGGDE
ncbi:GpE family phage tail protein [Salmonella enterica]|nr:GpE family phage tail protein [Salmonella enterica]EGL7479601.1 GpE family phage tail protein [Salmonella enterica]EIZ2335797.1 GpE family phage tail protein [Salmonella enterica]